ncbi:class I SAM-dependent methyltransferase [Opitutales bacterium]|nr:class I SAM-dependent methyltransferase [Opitutales bacterium]
MSINEIIQDIKNNPPGLLLGDANLSDDGEYKYAMMHHSSYIRTISDIMKFAEQGATVLELGAFTGVVSIALKRLGFDVIASDIPEFFDRENVRSYYKKEGIQILPLNLRGAQLPYDDSSIDVVCMCETLEHLNFNPLPLLKEINRVIKPGGMIYVAMPNFSRVGNRFKALVGLPIYSPIEDYLKQLSREHNMLVGLHWREYTMNETKWMLSKMGFSIKEAYYFSELNTGFFRRIANFIPSLRQSVVVIASKSSNPDYDFWITDANT